MAEKTDLRKVQAALDRAAHKAVHGPREAQSGRFVLEKPHAISSRTAASALTQSKRK
jgi:hypothetical protein